jgi:hypothetical protein
MKRTPLTIIAGGATALGGCVMVQRKLSKREKSRRIIKETFWSKGARVVGNSPTLPTNQLSTQADALWRPCVQSRVRPDLTRFSDTAWH